MKRTIESHYISLQEKEEILKFLLAELALDLRNYSEASVRRRFTKIINDFNLKNAANLMVFLRNRPDGRDLFIRHFTVNVTEMFRDPPFFLDLIELIRKDYAQKTEYHIWSAGCSTGEEVLSLAILLQEADMLEKCRFYATDLNPDVVQRASEGMFQKRHLDEYGKSYLLAGGKHNLDQYYSTFGEEVYFEKSLLEKIEFRVENILDPPVRQYDLILCRNVLIYFDSILQNKVLTHLDKNLKNGGLLGLGSKESMIFYEGKHHFVELNNEYKIYQKH